MVKKLACLISMLSMGLITLGVGCNKSANPVIPAGAAVLHLTLPSKIPAALSKSVSGKDAVPVSGQGALEYYLSTEGQAPVTGVILFNDGSQVGNIFINLPQAGVWLVAAEYFSVSPVIPSVKTFKSKLAFPNLVTTPLFVGADEVNIQGTTSLNLNMEDIGYQLFSCYRNNDMTDSTDCDFNLNGVSWFDLFTFNTGVEAASNTTIAVAPVADIQALYDPVTTLSTYVGSPTGASFAYLGNGDFVNFPVVAGNAPFYPDTVAAKAAVLGSAGASIIGGDIFVVKGPESKQMVWMQFGTPGVDGNCLLPPLSNNSAFMSFLFIYNNEGLNYMKFDQTAYGAANCNQNAPTPTPAG